MVDTVTPPRIGRNSSAVSTIKEAVAIHLWRKAAAPLTSPRSAKEQNLSQKKMPEASTAVTAGHIIHCHHMSEAPAADGEVTK